MFSFRIALFSLWFELFHYELYNSHFALDYSILNCTIPYWSTQFSYWTALFRFEVHNSQIELYYSVLICTILTLNFTILILNWKWYTYHPNTSAGKECVRYFLPDYINSCADNLIESVDTKARQNFNNFIKSLFFENYDDSECFNTNCYSCRLKARFQNSAD